VTSLIFKVVNDRTRVLSNVSKEHTASVFRVEKKCDANSTSLTFKVISDK
jgi:hypothetical protein